MCNSNRIISTNAGSQFEETFRNLARVSHYAIPVAANSGLPCPESRNFLLLISFISLVWTAAAVGRAWLHTR